MNRSKGYGATPGDYEPVNHFERDVANEMLTRADDRIRALEAALRRARPYVLNHDCADAAELEATGLTMRAIDQALGSELETSAQRD